MKKKILACVVAACAVITTNAGAGISGGAAQNQRVRSESLLLVGPVSAVDLALRTVTVFGQELAVKSSTDFHVGETVAVSGTLLSDGTIDVLRVDREELYVPGATPVLLTGIVQSIDTLIGHIVVGGVTIDINAATSFGDSATLQAGDLVQVSGIQPVLNGLVLAQDIDSAVAQGISGGAAQGISGGAARGISGGAAQGISGGAARGISGGAAQGISGGAARGISGGAAQGICGGAAQGISGGAAQGISGGASR